MAFWSDEQLASIDWMLNPRFIAVVGATPRMQYGGRFLAAAIPEAGATGPVQALLRRCPFGISRMPGV